MDRPEIGNRGSVAGSHETVSALGWGGEAKIVPDGSAARLIGDFDGEAARESLGGDVAPASTGLEKGAIYHGDLSPPVRREFRPRAALSRVAARISSAHAPKLLSAAPVFSALAKVAAAGTFIGFLTVVGSSLEWRMTFSQPGVPEAIAAAESAGGPSLGAVPPAANEGVSITRMTSSRSGTAATSSELIRTVAR